MTGKSQTHGKGIERITTSVNISDQACAKYIMDVLIQLPGALSRTVQISEMGKHCSRLATKNAIVHATTAPIIIHEMIEKVLVMKILGSKSAYHELHRRR